MRRRILRLILSSASCVAVLTPWPGDLCSVVHTVRDVTSCSLLLTSPPSTSFLPFSMGILPSPEFLWNIFIWTEIPFVLPTFAGITRLQIFPGLKLISVMFCSVCISTFCPMSLSPSPQYTCVCARAFGYLCVDAVGPRQAWDTQAFVTPTPNQTLLHSNTHIIHTTSRPALSPWKVAMKQVSLATSWAEPSWRAAPWIVQPEGPSAGTAIHTRHLLSSPANPLARSAQQTVNTLAPPDAYRPSMIDSQFAKSPLIHRYNRCSHFFTWSSHL